MTRLPTIAIQGACLVALTLGAAADADAQTPAASRPIEIRRVFVPADVEVGRWPIRAERYLPVEAAEFERLLNQARAAGAVVEPPPETALAELELVGRWDDAAVLAGTGRFSIRLPGANVAGVPIAAPTWSIVDPRWNDGAPAVLGVDAQGRASLFADRTGDVAFGWSQRVVPDATGISTAVMRLPVAATVRLVIEARDDVAIAADGAAAETPVPGAPGYRRWTLTASGGAVRLRFIGGRSATSTATQAAVRQTLHYELSERGIDFTAELRIDALPAPLDRLDVELDPELTLVDVSVVDRTAAWTAPQGPKRTVTITFDRPLHGIARTVLLRGIGPLKVGARSRLPIVQASGLFWQQGLITLAVPAPLHVDRLDVRGGAASVPVPLTGTRAGRAYEAQCFDAGSFAEVVVSRRSEPIRQAGVVAVRIAPRDATAEYRSRLQVGAGEFFSLEAFVPARWIVDSVATVPPTALDDWSISELRDRRRLLTLRLAQALSPERPLQLTIVAHAKQSASDRVLQREDLRVAEFVGALDDAPIAAVNGDPTLRLQVERTDDASPPAEASLDPVRRELLGTLAYERLLDLGEAANWRLHTQRRLPHYDARLHVAARVEADRLEERYRLEIKNRESLPIERLIVRFRPAKSAALQWTIGEAMRGRLDARRLAPAAADSDVEQWQIDFHRPLSGDIDLRAVRTSLTGSTVEVSLPAVVDAVDQRGTLSIAAGAAEPLQLRTRSLTPSPPRPDHGGGPPIRGEFQFDPHQTAEAVPPSLSLSKPADAAPMPRGVVWRLCASAALESDGAVRHRAKLDVQALQPGSCRIVFPEGALDAAVEFDGERYAADADGGATVRFPTGRSLFSLHVGYAARDRASSPVRLVALPSFTIDLPVLYDERRLSIPSAYDAPIDAGFRSLSEAASYSWLRRLVGPLASPDAPSVGLAPLASGRPRPDDAAGATPADARAVEQALAAATKDLNPRTTTWGSWWGAVLARRDPQSVRLLFDAETLRAAGLGPHDRVADRAPYVADAPAAGERFLAAAGLHLRVEPRGLVVSAQPADDDHDAVRVFPSLGTAAGGEPDRTPVDFETWLREGAAVWPTAADRTSRLGAPGVAGAPLPAAAAGVWVVRRETPTAIAVALVLLAFAAGKLLLPYRRTWWCLAAGGAAIAALVSPAWLSVGATSLLLGLTFAAAAELVLPRRRRVRGAGLGVAAAPRELLGEPFGRATGAKATILLVAGWASAAQGVDPETPQLVERPSTYEVLIPVGPDRKPTSGRYQVPESLMRVFERRSELRTTVDAAPAVWKRAEYAAALARDPQQKRFVVTELKATLDGQAFQSPSTVDVPLETGGAETIVSALLDGRLVDVERTSAGLRFTAPAAGPFRFELTFRPPTIVDGGRSGLNFAVPPVHDAQLRLAVPSGFGGLEVAAAAAPAAPGDDQRSQTVRLLPASRLIFSWTDEPAPAGTTGVVEQLMWVKVRPGSTVVDARFRVRTTRPMSELVLRSDPRLQWLPKRSERSAVADVRSTPIVVDQGTVAERLTVRLTKPIVDDGVVDVSFLMTGVRGVGRIRIPELRPDDGPAPRRFLAYSVDPLLEATVTGGAGLTQAAVPEFMRLWGPGEAQLPQAAYDMTAGESDWTLASRPAAPRVEADVQQTVVCGRRRIDVVWEAEADVVRGAVTRYELQVPADLRIESIAAIEIGGDGGDQALEWSRDDRGDVLVLLRAAAGGKHRLTLRASAASPGDRASLPIVSLKCDAVRRHVVRLVRRFEALLAVEKPRDLEASSSPAGEEPNPATGRTVAEYRVVGPAPAAEIRIEPNPQEFTSQAVTTLTADDAKWQCEFNLTLNVTRGVLDEIELVVPPEVALPLAVAPAMPYEVLAGDGRDRRVLLRPRTPPTAAFQLTIRAPLEERRDEATVPFIRLGKRREGDYYVRLPVAVGVNPVRWETDQLAPAGSTMPPVAAARNREFVALRVVGPKPKAALRPVAGVSGRPFIRLADHRLAVDEYGGYFGVSTFLVEPSGLKSLALRVPEGVELLQTLSDGALTTLLVEGDSLRRLALASDQMPQLVDVVYRTQGRTETGGTFDAAVPAPEEVPVERSLWTIVEPHRARLEPLAGVGVSPLRLETQRLEMLDAALSDLRPQGTLDAVTPWSAPLLRRRDRVRGAILRLSGAAGEAERREAQRLLDDSDRNTDAWRTEETASPGRGATVVDVDELWNSTVSPYAAALCLGTADGRSVASVRVIEHGPTSTHRAIALVGGLAVLVLWRWWSGIDAGARWGHVLGVVTGAAWIVWLRPAFIGWVIIVVVLACRWHPSIRRARRRPAGLPRSLAVTR